MTGKAPRSPQEKKALSYERDCRNVYSENDKASRKLIPLRKAQDSRRVRRKVAQDIAAVPRADGAAAELIESDARWDIERLGGWRKGADEPLGKMIARAAQRREHRTGRKARAAAARGDPDA